eukprot:g14480.t1
MDEAEDACSQALGMKPANAKAFFRRGQARLALGRRAEAAGDFSEVCLLEPHNAEAVRMLRLAREGEQARTPPAGNSSRERESGKSRAAAPTTHICGQEALPRETSWESESGDISRLKNTEAGCDAEKKRVEPGGVSSAPPSGSSFMVPGWLDSAARKQREHPPGSDNGNVDVYPRHLDGSADDDRPPAARLGGVEGAMSVSRLVSQLSKKGASKKVQGEPAASGTAVEVMQAEWSRLQEEEDLRVQESLRRWSTVGGSHAEEQATKGGVKGEHIDAEDGKFKERTAAKVKKETVQAGGSKEREQTSQLWASLEEEESRMREAFRANLGVGKKVSLKEKLEEKRKKKNKRR